MRAADAIAPGLTARERRAALAARDDTSDVPQEPEFAPGDRVVHASFGRGVVVSCELVAGDQQVTVAFEGQGVKKLMLSFAPLAAEASGADEEQRDELEQGAG